MHFVCYGFSCNVGVLYACNGEICICLTGLINEIHSLRSTRSSSVIHIMILFENNIDVKLSENNQLNPFNK